MSLVQQENLSNGTEPIALIGIGLRLPGNIASPEDLLNALREGRDL
jgi:acyl transferase domain-containing protein